MICPCCHQPVTPGRELESFAARQSPLRARLLRELIAAWRPLPASALVDVVYGGCADGGPEDAVGVLRVTICNLRRELRAIGWTIQAHRWAGYELRRLDAVAAVLE